MSAASPVPMGGDDTDAESNDVYYDALSEEDNARRDASVGRAEHRHAAPVVVAPMAAEHVAEEVKVAGIPAEENRNVELNVTGRKRRQADTDFDIIDLTRDATEDFGLSVGLEDTADGMKNRVEQFCVAKHCRMLHKLNTKTGYGRFICERSGAPKQKKSDRKSTSKKCGCTAAIAFKADTRDDILYYTLNKVSLQHTNGCEPSAAQEEVTSRRFNATHIDPRVLGLIATKLEGGCSARELRAFIVNQNLSGVIKDLDHKSLWKLRLRIKRIQVKPGRACVCATVHLNHAPCVRTQDRNLAQGKHKNDGLSALRISAEELQQMDDDLNTFFLEEIEKTPAGSSRLLRLAKHLSERMPGFKYKYRLNSKGIVECFTWVTGRMPDRAKAYGQLIFVDAGHSTNAMQYKLTPMTVIDHNNKHRITSYMLHSSECDDHFLWYFEAMEEMLPGLLTVSALQGVCLALAADCKGPFDTLEDKYHLRVVYCWWHLKRAMERNLKGGTVAAVTSFVKEQMFWKCDTEEKFWQLREALRQQYPAEYEAIKQWFTERKVKRWGGPWVKHVFTATRTTTQAVENSILYVSVQLFVNVMLV